MEIKKPFRLFNRMDTETGNSEIWKLPLSLYAIYQVKNGFMIVEVYLKEDTIYIKYPYAQKTYNSYLECLEHLEYNFNIEKDYICSIEQ